MMSDYLSFDALMSAPAATAVERDVPIAGLGVVRVRALSLHEYWKLRTSAMETGTFSDERWQTLVLSTGMVSPRVSYDEAWQLGEKAYGLVGQLVTAIVEMTMVTPLGDIPQQAVDEAEASFQG